MDRRGYAAVLGLLAGVAITVIVFVIVLQVRDGGDDNGAVVGRTPTPGETAGASSTKPAVVTETPPLTTPTASGSFTDPDDALASFVEESLHETYVGPCPQQPPTGGVQGICSFELYRSDLLLTAYVGPALSEALGEAVVTKDEGGKWTVSYVPAPPAGATLAVGGQAVAYGAGDCLNFRQQPAANATVTTCQLDGTRGRVAEGPTQEGATTWWRIQDLGWASGQYLIPAQ